jgi:hypothetical protein
MRCVDDPELFLRMRDEFGLSELRKKVESEGRAVVEQHPAGKKLSHPLVDVAVGFACVACFVTGGPHDRRAKNQGQVRHDGYANQCSQAKEGGSLQGQRSQLLMRLLLVIGLAVLGCDAQPSTSEDSDRTVDSIQLNALIVMIGSLRRDRLGVHGHRRPTSPKIDTLARDGVIH